MSVYNTMTSEFARDSIDNTCFAVDSMIQPIKYTYLVYKYGILF